MIQRVLFGLLCTVFLAFRKCCPDGPPPGEGGGRGEGCTVGPAFVKPILLGFFEGETVNSITHAFYADDVGLSNFVC